MQYLKNIRTQKIIDAICMILLGILFVVVPEMGQEIFCIVAAVILYVVGIYCLVAYFYTFLLHDPALLIRALLLFLVASLILSFPGTFLYLSVILASIYLIVEGVVHLNYTFDLKKLNDKNWWIDLVYSIVMLGCGVALITVLGINQNAANAVNLMMILTGSFAIFDGLFELLIILFLHRDFKQAKKDIIDYTK
jgi:uncharacterized membrane protein HdeD (DUF308 family)